MKDHKLLIANQSSSANSDAASRASVTSKGVTNMGSSCSTTHISETTNVEWKRALVGRLSAILCGAIELIHAFMLGSLISEYFMIDRGEIITRTRMYALCYLGLTMFSYLASIDLHYNFAVMGECLTKRIRENILTKILTFEVAWFDPDDNSSGAICSRLARDANVFPCLMAPNAVIPQSVVIDRVTILIQIFSLVSISCTIGLFLSWRLGLVLIAVQPLIVVSRYCQWVLLKSMSKKTTRAQDESSRVAAEARKLTKHQHDKIKDNPGIALGTSQSITYFTRATTLRYGGKLISKGQITKEEIFQTFLILISCGRAIADAASMNTDLDKGFDTVKSVFSILDRCTKINSEDKEGFEPDDIMGHSGSGKSTIISLIERFYDPIQGMVKIDGREIRPYHLRSLRKHIALVSQEPILFSEQATRGANAHDFITGLNNGYQTTCGDKGVKLTGGQKQRIAIARAILKNPSVLLLDKATSARDVQSETVVQHALEHFMLDRTSVVLAYRLSTVQNCDIIVVLEKGKVVEEGTHSSLLAKGSTR
ncbi:LOW QUALITY PROTEIN: ABC transporter type 1, transmembrane domain [Dillenia turbinata]|uniref:ABC transporter type 1, transmembrane domain n=1 Tax=Dillenia turbinata TaxID=194707 RepID=A0AAN8V1A0_9MAGN